jgi:hypothetical protein
MYTEQDVQNAAVTTTEQAFTGANDALRRLESEGFSPADRGTTKLILAATPQIFYHVGAALELAHAAGYDEKRTSVEMNKLAYQMVGEVAKQATQLFIEADRIPGGPEAVLARIKALPVKAAA